MRLETRRKLENREFKKKKYEPELDSYRRMKQIIDSLPGMVDDEIIKAARSVENSLNGKPDMDIEAVQKEEKKENILGTSVPKEKPIKVSYTVTFICSIKLLDWKFLNVFNILLGLLVIKLSIKPLFAPISHAERKIIKSSKI